MAKPSTDVKTEKKAALSNALTVLHSKLAVILPILTPDQREKLAIHIEQGHQKPQKPAAL